ncbi:diacylglycerol kinase [Thalassotalea sp. ND16A]|uniref:diacylglycerol kinase n=1 Tax=Thalassotalea sp. ND16A TaxID=1535422 RepID=UPI00051A3EBA|nr:diacylglycerol kinase [Thalassotalea sp. ND16A]KGJ88776.1 hypothetical protein ND16A_2478 [Thalassotalea sp. ND16A]
MNNNQQPLNKPNGTGLKRLFKATYCSLLGFKAAWQHEAAFRQESVLVLVLLPFSFVIATSVNHWLMLLFSLLFLLFAELVNSALEALADKITLQHDELIGRAKDIGSALVFIALMFLKVIWIIATLQYFQII